MRKNSLKTLLICMLTENVLYLFYNKELKAYFAKRITKSLKVDWKKLFSILS